MLSNTENRISAEEAAKLAGYDNVTTFERAVMRGVLPVTRYKASRNAKPFYSKSDIENHLEKTALKKIA